jgi:hypothetical protein
VAGDSGARADRPSRHRLLGLIIVARDQPELWHHLTEHFAGQREVQVFLDRRQWERRQRFQTYEPERRRAARRRPLSRSTDLRYRSFLLIPQHHDRAEDSLPGTA